MVRVFNATFHNISVRSWRSVLLWWCTGMRKPTYTHTREKRHCHLRNVYFATVFKFVITAVWHLQQRIQHRNNIHFYEWFLQQQLNYIQKITAQDTISLKWVWVWTASYWSIAAKLSVKIILYFKHNWIENRLRSRARPECGRSWVPAQVGYSKGLWNWNLPLFHWTHIINEEEERMVGLEL